MMTVFVSIVIEYSYEHSLHVFMPFNLYSGVKSVDDRRSSMDLVGSSADNALRALSKDEPPKRVEPLRGSERFLDLLSRIPVGNPTTNGLGCPGASLLPCKKKEVYPKGNLRLAS